MAGTSPAEGPWASLLLFQQWKSLRCTTSSWPHIKSDLTVINAYDMQPCWYLHESVIWQPFSMSISVRLSAWFWCNSWLARIKGGHIKRLLLNHGPSRNTEAVLRAIYKILTAKKLSPIQAIVQCFLRWAQLTKQNSLLAQIQFEGILHSAIKNKHSRNWRAVNLIAK